MANHHLRNKTLSLKAKGLLSQMLSLPENWDYTLKGLAMINRECVDTISDTVRELETAGYIVRDRKRNNKGQLQAIVYTIYERPGSEPKPDKDKPDPVKPIQEKPIREKPVLVKPVQENPVQLNTKRISTESSNTDEINTDPSNPYPSKAEEMRSDPDEIAGIRQKVMNNIEYDYLVRKFDQSRLDEIVELITEILRSSREQIVISGENLPAAQVKSRLLKLRDEHIEYVFECLDQTTTRVRNIKKYLLAALYNAPTTIDSYYTALVNHDDHHLSSFLDDSDEKYAPIGRRPLA